MTKDEREDSITRAIKELQEVSDSEVGEIKLERPKWNTYPTKSDSPDSVPRQSAPVTPRSNSNIDLDDNSNKKEVISILNFLKTNDFTKSIGNRLRLLYGDIEEDSILDLTIKRLEVKGTISNKESSIIREEFGLPKTSPKDPELEGFHFLDEQKSLDI